MDRISFLPDDLLLHVFSLLPTKDLLTTTVLSKRWRNFWKLVPKLQYVDIVNNDEHWKFSQFVDRSLLLHKAPVLQRLHFRLDRKCNEVDIEFWVGIAVERGLRELIFEDCHSCNQPSRLPQSLYRCGTLVVLKFVNVSLVNVQFPVCFQLLKTLHLVWVIFRDDETPRKLLSSCPVLEVLQLNRSPSDNVTTFSVMVPSLQRFIYNSTALSDPELLIDAPSLKYLKINDCGDECKIECMPDIVEAHVEVTCINTDDILKSLASLKRLILCLAPESPVPSGIIFHHLVHLEFCICFQQWDLLMSMLQHSPKLRSLKLSETHDKNPGDPMSNWEEPSVVPESLMFVLETFEWRNYQGWKVERDLAKFFLKHSRRLKIANFSPNITRFTTLNEKYHMITELARFSRGSTECQLVFG